MSFGVAFLVKRGDFASLAESTEAQRGLAIELFQGTHHQPTYLP
jgi:hypothetical protein